MSALFESETKPGLAVGEEKLTDWAQEPSLATLKKDVEGAKEITDTQVGKVTAWLDNLRIEGGAKITPRRGRSQVQPKLIRKQAEWRYTALTEPFLNNDKLFQVAPRTSEDRNAADQNELVLNWQFDTKLNKVWLIDQYVRNAVDKGTVIVRVGWCRETKTVPIQAPVYSYYPITDPEQAQALAQTMQLVADDPSQMAGLAPDIQESVRYSQEKQLPHLAKQTGTQTIEQEQVLKNEPTVELIPIRNLYVDPSCQGDPDKALFMAYTFESVRGALERDKRYQNLDKVQWQNASPLGTPDHESQTPSTFNFADTSRQKAVVTEYWGWFDTDGSGHLVSFVAAWIGNVLIRLEESPFPDRKPPFVIVPYLPVDGSVYGEPDGELLTDNQKIIGALTRGVIDLLARSANGQRGMAKSMLDVVNRRRFDNGEDYEFNPNVHPSQGVVEHKYPEVPNSALALMQMFNGDAESLTAVKTFEGLTGEALGPTAAGAKGVLSAAGKRESSILRRLAMGMAQVGRKIAAMNQEFLSEEETIRVTNAQFVKVKREDLKGDFDLKVDIATVEEDEAKAGRLEFMLQTMAQGMSPDMVHMIMAEIAHLRRMPDLAHKIKTYQPQPDPVAQQKAQLELQELQAKIRKYDADAQLALAQIPLKQAEARVTHSTADKTDLDFVEQQGGTQHARKMDEIGEQASANTNLEITKAILNQRNGRGPDGKVDTSPTEENIHQAVGYHAVTAHQ